MVFVSWEICLLAIAKFLFKTPLIVSFVGGERDISSKKRLMSLKINFTLLVADRVTVVTESLKNEMEIDFGYKQAIYIPYFRNSSSLANQTKQFKINFEPDNFIFCGRLAPEKQLPLLIEAYSRAVSEGCQALLYIVGSGSELEKCQYLRKKLNLQEKVIFLGEQKYEIALQMIRDSRCLILCSWTESNPQVALEAMSFGKPVICSNITGVKEIIIDEQTGLLFNSGSVVGLSQAILRISTDLNLSNKLGSEAYRHVSRLFTEFNFSNQMIELYSELLNNQIIQK